MVDRRVPYQPQVNMVELRAFDEQLRKLSDSWNIVRSFLHAGDPRVISLRWIIPGELWCDEASFLDFLDVRAHRLLLRCFLHQDIVTRDVQHLLREHIGTDTPIAFQDIQHIWTVEQLLQKIDGIQVEALRQALHFLHLQELIIQHRADAWVSGLRLQAIGNLGSTFEWMVQARLQQEYQAVARRCVSFKEWQTSGLNDLDVVAFLNNLVLIVECKSSTDVSLEQIARFVQRSQAFPADVALLLIDTTSQQQVTKRLQQIHTILGNAVTDIAEQQCTWKGSEIAHVAKNLYVANTAGGIAASLAGVLHIAQNPLPSL